ncbi:HD domain-containing protein [Haliovirga abyssi]|uniref:Phosphohydrolase n=1 Tax=Haliovirga abyssi TaxID=2996794 RepID=A0AAU9D9D4_9FUSO|nr:HD domain-containing protein [Haliovirga abyssi]BDU49900.1 phosphohydrolase [Haliovirga abyssi]
MADKNVRVFVNGILLHPVIQKLKLVDDKGITVSTHTYDVLRVAIKQIKSRYFDNLEEASEDLDFFAILIGILIHDTTKGTLRLSGSKNSHSYIMRNNPDIVMKEAESIIEEVENFTKLNIKKETRDHIIHIVASHHGRWGRIKPQTKEAHIVHEADKYSAMYHRITPIGAKKIIKLMSDGFSKDEVVKITGYTSGIIDNRLKRAKQELNIKTNRGLLSYYNKYKSIPDGDEFFSRRIRETEKLIKKVEVIGFEDLVLKNILIDYIYREDIFE